MYMYERYWAYNIFHCSITPEGHEVKDNRYPESGYYGNIMSLTLFFENYNKFTIMSRGKIILGALAGLAAGALIGILFAPEKGTSTRKKIVNKGEEYVDNLKDKISNIMKDGIHRDEKVRETAA